MGRAVDPADEASLTAAFDGTLRGLLARFPDARSAARAEAINYTTAFSPELETSADELAALAGWTPTLTETQASLLTEAAIGGATREQFVAALHAETDLSNTWAEGFLTGLQSPEKNGSLS